MDDRCIVCSRCHGTKIEPSAITTYREPCFLCDGAGRLKGVPDHPIPFQEFVNMQAALRARASIEGKGK